MAMNRRTLQPGERIRVMVVDDSVVIRRLVTRALEQDTELQVVGAASNGLLGLQRIPQLDPDVVTLDIEMPDMNGLEMLRCIRRDYPYLRVIMFSTLTERGAAITLEALTLGADDYVAKVSNEGSLDQSMFRLKTEMIPKIKQFFRSSVVQAEAAIARSGVPGSTRVRFLRERISAPEILVIGTSTGGPGALAEILPLLPSTYPLPIMVVQHMPPLFTRFLSERLDSLCQLHVEEASDGAMVARGKVLIAPGDFHMRLVANPSGVSVGLDQSAQQNFCRPAVDVLFRSAAEIYGGSVLAVVLTGMGRDGLRGAEVLKARGARVFAQDEPTSVVWGMPGAITNAGLADRVLPLNQMVREILRASEGR
jgi:two-component system, chemotaxis family, protein-glutamate methylesterase/glutaminase